MRAMDADVQEAADVLENAVRDDTHQRRQVADYLLDAADCIHSCGSEVDCSGRTQRAETEGIHLVCGGALHLEVVDYSWGDRTA